MNTPSAEVSSARGFRFGDFLRDQLRNIAPFITLLCLIVFFSVASPSFATLGNLVNILQQVSVTAMIRLNSVLMAWPRIQCATKAGLRFRIRTPLRR